MKNKRHSYFGKLGIPGFILLVIICVSALSTVDASYRDTVIMGFLGGLLVGVILASAYPNQDKDSK